MTLASTSEFFTPVEESDLKYWYNATFPVIFIVYHPEDDQLYWKDVRTYVRSTPNVWQKPYRITFNKAKVRRFYEEACNTGNLAAIDDLVAPEDINHPYPGDPDPGRGPEATKQFVTTLRTSWPDIRIAVEHQIAEGDWVMTRWTARGTYQGGDPTLPATAIGKPATITGISINRFVVFTRPLTPPSERGTGQRWTTFSRPTPSTIILSQDRNRASPASSTSLRRSARPFLTSSSVLKT